MKRFFIIIFALALFTACQSNTKKAESESKAETTQVVELQELELTVTGMTCSGCENTVKNGLKQIDGVVEVQASHKNSKVTIKVEKDKVSREEIAQQIETIGYNVEK
ncbi:cation transporter [Labilibaculum sp. DW002]|uniref:Cation transporter n=1 Tax=Paralabilibaculum antarcticum TaxID=2912572 RepID=A0ABT5VS34_9BACT|nr:cation transporter [Labilibaculum sp. DW002]MDE5418235.1 cation transporter [Labilibaculum sp. DW002]